MFKLVVIFALIASSFALQTGIYSILKGIKQNNDSPVEDGETYPPALLKDTVLDNFNSSNVETFKQRWYVRDEYFKGDGPVFVCVGGEFLLPAECIYNNSIYCDNMVQLAPETGALLVALEHRYYGKSIPSTTDMQYLSSKQAIEDLATFHKYVSDKYKLTKSNKWVSFGGSYPGMLSSFFRLKHPELVHAAIANSAPVQARVDMQGYYEVIGQAFNETVPGGSPQCYNLFVGGHRQIEKDLKTTAGQDKLGKQFNICGGGASLAPAKNQAAWASNGVVFSPGQGNDPSCTTENCNYKKMCSFLIEHEDPNDITAALAAMSAWQNGGSCVHVSYEEKYQLLKEKAEPNMYAWFYQTCREFGFYQSCELNSTCPFARGLGDYVNVSLSGCQEMYNFTKAEVYQHIEDSNEFYGGWKPNGSRIFYINGQIDPWHSLSVLPGHSPNPTEMPTYWVLGAAHMFWARTNSATTTKYCREAQKVIQAQVKEWLAEDDVFLQ